METAEGTNVPDSTIYDGFIAHSHAAYDLLAPRLQAALQRFARLVERMAIQESQAFRIPWRRASEEPLDIRPSALSGSHFLRCWRCF